MSASTPRRQRGVHLFVKRDQADGVLLHGHQIGQRCGQAGRIFELRHRLAFGEPHRGRKVHHQIAGQIRFRFETLDVIAIRLGVDQPIDQFRVVAAVVSPVFAELHRETLEGTRMQSLQESADDHPRSQIESLDLLQRFG